MNALKDIRTSVALQPQASARRTITHDVEEALLMGNRVLVVSDDDETRVSVSA